MRVFHAHLGIKHILEFKNDERKSVDENEKICAPAVLANDLYFICTHKGIFLRFLIIDRVEVPGLFLARSIFPGNGNPLGHFEMKIAVAVIEIHSLVLRKS